MSRKRRQKQRAASSQITAITQAQRALSTLSRILGISGRDFATPQKKISFLLNAVQKLQSVSEAPGEPIKKKQRPATGWNLPSPATSSAAPPPKTAQSSDKGTADKARPQSSGAGNAKQQASDQQTKGPKQSRKPMQLQPNQPQSSILENLFDTIYFVILGLFS